MAVTAEQIYAQIEGSLSALEKISAKEREQQPSKEFGDDYNRLLALAKETMPAVDARRWPPAAKTLTSPAGYDVTNARYLELHAYLEQIAAILAEGIEPSFLVD